MSENIEPSEEMKNSFLGELFGSPLNIVLIGVCAYLLYRILKKDRDDTGQALPPNLSPMRKRDFTPEELKSYDGKQGEGRILIAINGKVFDVTRGKRFYGPGGPYGIFAGRDASRGLGSMSLDQSVFKDEYDDISDLTASQLDIIKDWEMQFNEKYDLVGRLLRPGEEPKDYECEQEGDKKED